MMFERLLIHWIRLGKDEREILVETAKRLEDGQRNYGAFDLETDKRDFVKEALAESLDLNVYLLAMLKQMQRRLVGKRAP